MYTSIWTCMSHYPRHVSGLDMPIFRRNNCTNTASGILSLLGGCTLHRLSVVCSRLVERVYQMLCLCSCSSWRWACQGPKHVEDNMTYVSILKCALKLVLKNILSSRLWHRVVWQLRIDSSDEPALRQISQWNILPSSFFLFTTEHLSKPNILNQARGAHCCSGFWLKKKYIYLYLYINKMWSSDKKTCN